MEANKISIDAPVSLLDGTNFAVLGADIFNNMILAHLGYMGQVSLSRVSRAFHRYLMGTAHAPGRAYISPAWAMDIMTIGNHNIIKSICEKEALALDHSHQAFGRFIHMILDYYRHVLPPHWRCHMRILCSDSIIGDGIRIVCIIKMGSVILCKFVFVPVVVENTIIEYALDTTCRIFILKDMDKIGPAMDNLILAMASVDVDQYEAKSMEKDRF